MESRRLGKTGPMVSQIGLGCMGMTGGYGPATEAEALATFDAALDAGINLIDTGDFYSMGANELLVAKALRGRRDKAVVCVKFGAQRGPDGAWLGYDARPVAVKTACAYSLKRLGTDYIDIYQPARLDPNVPIEETVGAITDLIKAGYVRHVGLSEVSVATVRRALAVSPVVELQIEYGLMSRGIERDILPAMRELGVSITAYGVLSRGLLSGHWRGVGPTTPGDIRTPRFAGANLAANLKLVDRLEVMAKENNVTTGQIVIAWAVARGPDVIPLIGARRPDQIEDAVEALALDINAQDMAAIEAAVPADAVAGARYAPAQMATLDSERG